MFDRESWNSSQFNVDNFLQTTPEERKLTQTKRELPEIEKKALDEINKGKNKREEAAEAARAAATAEAEAARAAATAEAAAAATAEAEAAAAALPNTKDNKNNGCTVSGGKRLQQQQRILSRRKSKSHNRRKSKSHHRCKSKSRRRQLTTKLQHRKNKSKRGMRMHAK